jgi:hypothetical protein
MDELAAAVEHEEVRISLDGRQCGRNASFLFSRDQFTLTTT